VKLLLPEARTGNECLFAAKQAVVLKYLLDEGFCMNPTDTVWLCKLVKFSLLPS